MTISLFRMQVLRAAGVLCLLPSLAVAQERQWNDEPVHVEQRPAAAEETRDREIPSLKELFAASITDFKTLPARSNLMVIGVGLAAAGPFVRSDRAISNGLSTAGWSDGPFDATSLTGQFPLHVAAGFAAYGVGRAAHQPRVAQFGADLVRAQLLAQGTTQAIKFAVNRTRPDGTHHSFPSGHTSTMFATATVVQRHFGWKAGVPAYAAAAWVAAGRIQAKRHYLTDVAVGAALGIVAGRTVTIGRGRARFAVAPMAAPGGIGIGFSLVR